MASFSLMGVERDQAGRPRGQGSGVSRTERRSVGTRGNGRGKLMRQPLTVKVAVAGRRQIGRVKVGAGGTASGARQPKHFTSGWRRNRRLPNDCGHSPKGGRLVSTESQDDREAAGGSSDLPESLALPRAFYARPAAVVARELVGKILVHRTSGGLLRARIVETEAYVGAHDLACHASKGRTPRTEVMFGPAGHAYVYLIYGMYDMFNIVTGRLGDAEAVLIRAAEGIDIDTRLDGPGKLTRGLGITRQHNVADLCRGPIVLASGPAPVRIATGPRVNVEYAGDWARAHLRFADADSDAVSAPRPRT